MVPVSIADAICPTTPLIEVSSLVGSSMGNSHFLPLSFDTTTLFLRRSIVTFTECCISVCRLAHRLGVLMARACAPAEVHYFCRIANVQSIHCLFSKGHGFGVWFLTQHPVNLRIYSMRSSLDSIGMLSKNSRCVIMSMIPVPYSGFYRLRVVTKCSLLLQRYNFFLTFATRVRRIDPFYG